MLSRLTALAKLDPGLMTGLATTAFVLGGVLGGVAAHKLHRAGEASELRKENRQLSDAVAAQVEIGRGAVALTRALSEAASGAVQGWIEAAGVIEIEIRTIESEGGQIREDLRQLEDPSGDLDRPAGRGLCELEARSIGHDPDLWCAAIPAD
jgi:hypothetical protein